MGLTETEPGVYAYVCDACGLRVRTRTLPVSHRCAGDPMPSSPEMVEPKRSPGGAWPPARIRSLLCTRAERLRSSPGAIGIDLLPSEEIATAIDALSDANLPDPDACDWSFCGLATVAARLLDPSGELSRRWAARKTEEDAR